MFWCHQTYRHFYSSSWVVVATFNYGILFLSSTHNISETKLNCLCSFKSVMSFSRVSASSFRWIRCLQYPPEIRSHPGKKTVTTFYPASLAPAHQPGDGPSIASGFWVIVLAQKWSPTITSARMLPRLIVFGAKHDCPVKCLTGAITTSFIRGYLQGDMHRHFASASLPMFWGFLILLRLSLFFTPSSDKAVFSRSCQVIMLCRQAYGTHILSKLDFSV